MEEGISHYFDRNLYCDVILDVILKQRKAGNARNLFFLCFEPDVCLMYVSSRSGFDNFKFHKGNWFCFQNEEKAECLSSDYVNTRRE